MISRLTVFLFSVFTYVSVFAQPGDIVSGPMLGPVELRDAKIWLQVTKDIKTVSLQFKKKNDTKTRSIIYKENLGNEFNPIQLIIGGLEFNTTYEYQFI